VREKLCRKIAGVIPAMVTPMDEHGEIDEDGLRRLTQIFIDAKVNGLFPLGTIGEGPKLDRTERMRVIEIVLDEVKSDMPVVPGTGGMTTKTTIQFTEDAKKLGATAGVIHPPWYFHPSIEALIRHYRKTTEETDFPIILYNIPSFVGYSISPQVVVELSKVESIMGIKESSAQMLFYQQLISISPRDFNVIQGYGSLFLPSLAIGATTTLCGEANLLPYDLVTLHKAFFEGKFDLAKKMHYRLVKLSSVIGYGTFPVGVKEAMNIMGLPGGYTREPAVPLKNEERGNLKAILKELELIE
jgi:4-hydroxy-tetrahydrodipicolinate synthase